MKIPIVKLVDGSSGGGSVTTIEKEGWSYLPAIRNFNVVCRQLNAGIPNLGAVVGPAIGLGAARVVACHFSVMAADIGSLFNAGPNVVANATFEEGLGFTDLGGPMMHCTNGTIDNIAADEAGCYDQIRTILQYLPNHGLEAPPVLPSNDPDDRATPNMRTLIPRRRERMFPAHKLLEIVDKDSWFEIGALWGRTAICGLARLAGYPIGVIINNSEVNGGALDTPGSQKLTKHLKFLDVFNIPLVQFIDVPGFAIGTVAERTATMRWGVGLAGAYCGTTMPIFNVLTRKAYGVAGQLMIAAREPRTLVAWPSGEWGSLPLAGGIEVGHAYELKQLEKEKGAEARQARFDELMENYRSVFSEHRPVQAADTINRRLQNPVRTANAFGVEEIIDPADTRHMLCTWVRHVYDTLMPIRLAERANGRIAPMFY
jgi:acetyl-CoA carboxylase carboxyltransferase component